jgi:hypothetical protein
LFEAISPKSSAEREFDASELPMISAQLEAVQER